MGRLIEELRSEIGYDPDAEGSVDDLIAYKDALEDLVGRVDELAVCTSATAAAGRTRAQRGLDAMGAADVTAALFGMGFGE